MAERNPEKEPLDAQDPSSWPARAEGRSRSVRGRQPKPVIPAKRDVQAETKGPGDEDADVALRW
jgi:hypothetical protein